jgi:hypothetical protein
LICFSSILDTKITEEDPDEDEPLQHDYIYKYDSDPYLEMKDTKMDIITSGVLSAFYGESH